MKVSLDWLKEYVDYSGDPHRLADIFSDLGFPLDALTQVNGDWVLDLDVTSNRPDCLGHIGLARELAAATGWSFRLPPTDFTEQGKPVGQWTSVVNEAPDLCSRYTARIIDHLTVAPSPEWMARRLEAVGLRPISNVVDITNYVMMEVGQPLHTFDYTLLKQGRIVVRRARLGEQMTTIDHSRIELTPDMLVIADAEEPVALAGIMGGLPSEVTDHTRTVLLEAAHFDPLTTRRTSRTLTLGSESSFRFERNVDPVTTEWASRRAAALLEQLASGKVAPGLIDAWPRKPQPRLVSLRLSRLRALLGIDIPPARVTAILQALSFDPRYDQADLITCTVPSWRSDVSREVDLIEEVIRVHGYRHIPTRSAINITVQVPDPFQRTRRCVTETLCACGFYETVNVSFIEDRHLRLFTPDAFEPVRVRDLSRKTNNALRPSILPSLLAVRARNQAVGNDRCDLYELSPVHEPAPGAPLPHETIALGLLTDGDFRELRGAVEAVLRRLDRHAVLDCIPAALPWSAPDAGAELRLSDRLLGRIGRASPQVLQAFDLDQPVCLAELDFEQLVSLSGADLTLTPLPRFPGIQRDLSLVIDEAIPWSRVESTIRSRNIDDLRDIQFVGIYRGKGIDPGKKSLTLSLTFRRDDETLTHEQVDTCQQQLLAALESELSATLRTM